MIPKRKESCKPITTLTRRHPICRNDNGKPGPSRCVRQPVTTIRPFNEEETRAIDENDALLPEFFRVLLGRAPEVWGPDDFDAAFASWAGAGDLKGYDEETAVQILGAAFGQYCARTLNMHWVVITDEDGSAAALRGIKKDYRAFPFHAIRKRIRDREQGFFKPIYISLEQASEQDWAATRGLRPKPHVNAAGVVADHRGSSLTYDDGQQLFEPILDRRSWILSGRSANCAATEARAFSHRARVARRNDERIMNASASELRPLPMLDIPGSLPRPSYSPHLGCAAQADSHRSGRF
jgi:Domain of unknown function (DUF3806)